MRNAPLLFVLHFFAIALAAQPTAFVNVNVIPMDRERVLRSQTVIVGDGKIEKIGPAAKVKVPKDALRIDGRGRYLIPGLVDMHTHLMSDEDFPDELAPDELRIMIANGVTTIRLMIGTPEQLVLRARSAKGEIIAPTIWSASPHLTGREQGTISSSIRLKKHATLSANQRPPATISSRSRHLSSPRFTKPPSTRQQGSASASSATPTAAL
jgi:hypothetical protein